MKFPAILPPSDLLDQVSGIEDGLLKQNRLGRLGKLGVLVAAVQALLVVVQSDLWTTLMKAQWHDLFFGPGKQDGLLDKWPFLLALLILLLAVFFIAWKRFWLKESAAPFRYTYEINEFEPLGGPDTTFLWLRHDLANLLNERIGRLSILERDEGTAGADAQAAHVKAQDGRRAAPPPKYDSHIMIRGHYGMREVDEGNDRKWTMEVIPRVRIGDKGEPETLAHPVTFFFDKSGTGPSERGPAVGSKLGGLTPEDYGKVLERVYFSVATEIYKQIRTDVQHKIALLPTRYLRARAYFYEAEDYARSNTLDAYDEAQKLYDAAISYFVPGRQPRPKGLVRRVAALLRRSAARVRSAFRVAGSHVWNGAAKVELMVARAEIGLANVLVFRRMLASTSGRVINPMFEARPMAVRAVVQLEHLPKDVPGVRDALFDAQVTAAITWSQLGSPRKAKEALLEARRLVPSRPENDARFLYASSLVEFSPRSQLLLLERAVELEPEFEAAQFGLAWRAEMMWRARPGLEETVADAVLEEYGHVVSLNPGNLAAWANRGYIRWLLIGTKAATAKVETEEARKEFRRGREYKSLKRETYVAELDYGLARIAAETGDFLGAYHHFTEAATAYFAQGLSQGATNAWSAFSGYFFQFIDQPMLDRFRRYRNDVEHWYWLAHYGNKGSALHKSVMSFVETDFGEACFNYYQRSKDRSCLSEAKEAYERAHRLDPSYAIPVYDLYLLAQVAAADLSDTSERVDPETYAERLNEVEPEWLETKLAIMSLRASQAGREDEAGHQALREASEAEVNTQVAATEAEQLKPAENKYEGEGLQAAPYEPETATKGREGEARDSKNEAKIRRAEADGWFQDRDDHQRNADEILRILLPHGWLWRGGKAGADGPLSVDDPSSKEGRPPALRMKAFRNHSLLRRSSRFGRELKWEREFNDLHVVALYQWAQAHVAQPRRKTSDAARILALVEDRFWPDNFTIMRYFRKEVEDRFGARKPWRLAQARARAERKTSAPVRSWLFSPWSARNPETRLLVRLNKYNRILGESIESLLATDPRGWWALSWLDDGYLASVNVHDSRIALQCSTIGPGQQTHYLQQVLSEQAEPAALYGWVGDRLKALIDEVDGEPGWQAGEIITRCAEALEQGNTQQVSAELQKLTDRALDAASLSRLRLALRRSSSQGLKKLGGDLEKRQEDLRGRVGELRDDMFEAYQRALTLGNGPLVVEPIVESLRWLEPHDRVIAAFEQALEARQSREMGFEAPHDPIAEWPIVEALTEMVPHARALPLIDRFAERSEAVVDAGLLWRLGNAYVRLEQWSQSLRAYERSRDADDGGPPEIRVHSQDEHRLVVARPHWSLGQHEQALAILSEISPNEENLPAGWRTQLVETLGETDQLSSGSGYLQLRAWLEWQQEREGSGRAEARRDAGLALLALSRMRRSNPHYEWSCPERFENDPTMHPVVVPIILIAQRGMFPQLGDTPEVAKMINDYIPATQAAILRDTGVRVPGVRIRASGAADLEHGDYTIMLHELTVDSGNAVTDDEDPYQRMVVRGVEPMVRRYLDTFVGVQETEEMLQKWLTEAMGTETPHEALGRAIPTSNERIRLVQALQRLVRQKVPVIRIGSILDAFERGRAKGESMLDLVEGLRLALKDDLPGRDDDRLLVGVGDWEAPISEWVVRQNGSSFLALSADDEHEFEALLGAVRGTVGEDDRRPVALVVEDHTLRPFVQQAIEGRFADVVVVSEAELDGARVELRLPSEGALVEAQA